MDIKIGGVSNELLTTALAQAKDARVFLLEKMAEVISEPRAEMSEYAPKMYKVQINQDQIGTIIGPGGKTVRKIQEESGGASIEIQEDGTVIVGSPNEAVARKAIQMIEGLTKEVKIGEIYTGKVTRLLNFGVFVEILPGKEGLVHISQLGEEHVETVEDEVQAGDEVTVMVTEIDKLDGSTLRGARCCSEKSPRLMLGWWRRRDAAALVRRWWWFGGGRGGDVAGSPWQAAVAASAVEPWRRSWPLGPVAAAAAASRRWRSWPSAGGGGGVGGGPRSWAGGGGFGGQSSGGGQSPVGGASPDWFVVAIPPKAELAPSSSRVVTRWRHGRRRRRRLGRTPRPDSDV